MIDDIVKTLLAVPVLELSPQKLKEFQRLTNLYVRCEQPLATAPFRNDVSCVLIFLAPPPDLNNLDNVAIKSNAAYIRNGGQLYYIN